MLSQEHVGDTAADRVDVLTIWADHFSLRNMDLEVVCQWNEVPTSKSTW